MNRDSFPWPWLDDAPTHALPRLRHWLMAAAILFVMGLIVPVFASFA
ncbi:hypothetical protein [Sphingobium amiense]|nr:hypothetical protein [Sphingobium amiense]